MYFDLYNLLCETLFGSFWISVFAIALAIYIIMGIIGKMSAISVIFYISLYLMAMTLGFGNKWLTTMLAFGMLVFAYLAFKNATS